VHGPKNLDDFVVFAYDPATKKCKRITFSMDGSSADPTMHSLVHRQFYNAFTTVPQEPNRPKPDKENFQKSPHVSRETGTLRTSEWACDHCDTKFPSAGALRLHAKAHDPKPIPSIDEMLPKGVVMLKSEERYFCEICQRSFDESFKDLHIASHGEERVFCKICNRKFDTQESLDIHMKALPDHSPFSFGKRYETNPEILKARPHECSTCGKRFPRIREKLQHERIHDGK
jgi:Zinc finger, C2H2 type/C2H2-type zinc finger